MFSLLMFVTLVKREGTIPMLVHKVLLEIIIGEKHVLLRTSYVLDFIKMN